MLCWRYRHIFERLFFVTITVFARPRIIILIVWNYQLSRHSRSCSSSNASLCITWFFTLLVLPEWRNRGRHCNCVRSGDDTGRRGFDQSQRDGAVSGQTRGRVWHLGRWRNLSGRCKKIRKKAQMVFTVGDGRAFTKVFGKMSKNLPKSTRIFAKRARDFCPAGGGLRCYFFRGKPDRGLFGGGGCFRSSLATFKLFMTQWSIVAAYSRKNELHHCLDRGYQYPSPTLRPPPLAAMSCNVRQARHSPSGHFLNMSRL